MNIDNIIFKVIAGGKAYGLDLPTSDTDIRGVFLQPNEFLLGNGYIEQISDEKNDITYYEFNRYINLLYANNPNIIECIFTPEDKILYIDDKFKHLYKERNKFLTKKLEQTFGGYAISQIRKARGLNKKIVNPVDGEKKTPLDFCYIINKENGHVVSLNKWLEINNLEQTQIGLSQMPNGSQLFKVHSSKEGLFKGIVSEKSNELKHSEIPKEYPVDAFLTFNIDGYSCYCKKYKEYWEWVNKRNPQRYNDNTSHKENYDGKNMMHCVRLLDMAIEIGEGKGVNLLRPNREWLLSIRRGEVSYENLMNIVDEKCLKLKEVYISADLPDDIDTRFIHELIIKTRL